MKLREFIILVIYLRMKTQHSITIWLSEEYLLFFVTHDLLLLSNNPSGMM